MKLPARARAEVQAESNRGDVTLEGFAKMNGEVRKQLMYSEFRGTLGEPVRGMARINTPQLELRVNSGTITLHGEADRSMLDALRQSPAIGDAAAQSEPDSTMRAAPMSFVSMRICHMRPNIFTRF